MRPFKEVIIVDNIDGRGSGRLWVTNNTKFKLKQSTIHVLWQGSIDKFKKDFEIPEDAPLSTTQTGLSNGDNGEFVQDWNWTTLNFKFNYQVWYRDAAGTNSSNFYVLGSNNTINITCPNVLVFDGNGSNDNYIKYGTNNTTNAVYNPNFFPLPISITSFPTSDKVSGFQNVTGSGNDSLVYLLFRFGVNGNDIQICLATKDSGAFQVNNHSLVIPYASLTFTGFNKIKRLAGARDDI